MTGALDTIVNYLDYRKNLLGKCAVAAKVAPFYFRVGVEEEEVRDLLEINISYAIIMCRLKYRRVPKKLEKTVEGMAHYWKKYYNSDLGKGDPEEFIEKYKMTQK
jgi:hypothetical protein